MGNTLRIEQQAGRMVRAGERRPTNVVEMKLQNGVTATELEQLRRIKKLGQLVQNPYELCAFMREEIHACKTQYKVLARRCGLSPKTVSRLASGETKDPRIKTVLSLLFAMDRQVYIV